jgi:hypothetical protein
MAAIATSPAPSGAGFSFRWIVSRSVDSTFVIGSALAGYVYLLLYTVLHVKISYLWWIWSVAFDGTHIFATATRTYFDREARARNARLFYGSLAVCFSVGPLLVLLGAKALLYLLVGVWAYYHVIRQHYGFLVLYKVKNRDLHPLDNRLDRLFLGVMTIAPPFHRFFIHHPEELGLRLAFPRWEPLFWAVVVTAAVVWTRRQWMRRRAGEPVNVPKHLLLLGVIPLHWFTFAYMSWQPAVPTVTIVHNLQYHALIWFHNRNRYAAGERGRFGLIPPAVSRSLLLYVVVALAFSALYRIPGFQLGQASDLAFGFFAGFGLTHYYLDSRIWRVRHDPGLRAALAMEPSGA